MSIKSKGGDINEDGYEKMLHQPLSSALVRRSRSWNYSNQFSSVVKRYVVRCRSSRGCTGLGHDVLKLP